MGRRYCRSSMCDHCGCREYPPIAELTADHVVILELAGRLAADTEASRPVDHEARDRLLPLLRSHAAKEELGLYALLIAQGEAEEGAYDHLEGEHREVMDAIEAGRFGHLEHYALQRHIEEEEEGLFTRSTFWFDGDTWDRMTEAHRRVDAAT